MQADQYDLTVSDVAEILSVHPDTVRRWCKSGDLPSLTTPGGHRRFRRSDIDALFKAAATDEAAS